MLKRIVLALVAALCALYAGDYLSLRYRIPSNRPQFGTVQVRRSYATPLKNGRTQFTFDAPENQICVESLFSQLGYTPCWYLRRHAQQRIQY